MTQIKNQDLQLIEETINHYFDGMVQHNAESFKKAFQPSANMKWMEDTYQEVNAVDALSEYVNTHDPVETKVRINALNLAGNAANVQLELEYDTFSYVDFMHLLKIEGEWKIVSQTYTTLKKILKNKM